MRAAIINGELRPGERLNTEQLAKQWDVSSTPLRETYQRLAADGLVELIPQRGARVAELTFDDAREIYEIRKLLEPYALVRSIQHADADWVAEITAALEPLRHEAERGAPDLVALEDAHRRFHDALLSCCGSDWLLRIVRLLQDHSVRFRLASIEPRGGLSEVIQEHEELLEACVERDAEVAEQRLREHLQVTIDSLAAAGGDETGSAENDVDYEESRV